ncbi:hypothetical protein CRYO30217_02319 [Parvicella tangerina]|uniref:Carboxypeptidase regulatory-like domain-containing protein n=2 Tax=Parvicella tangerina TaxID=2829795 RepID=A0A916JPA9_9FLAO|nr:hypothetical protein CRYO30217_02319 [Parvicella tangerina]
MIPFSILEKLSFKFKLFSFLLLFGYTFMNFITIQKPEAQITGKILNSNGEPVIFAIVRIYQNENLISEVTTDFNGDFIIEKVNPNIYELVVITVSCDPYFQKDLKVNGNEKKEIGVITMNCISEKEAKKNS